MAYPAYQLSRSFKKAVRISGGDVVITSTSWTNFDTNLDMTLDAQIGDEIEYGINGMVDPSGAQVLNFDVGTLVSGSIVNAFAQRGAESGSNNGAVGWYCPGSVTVPVSGSVMYTLQAGDISSNSVTVRLRTRIGSAGSRTVYTSAVNPFQVWAKNLGPADPH